MNRANIQRKVEVAFFAGLTLGLLFSLIVAVRFGGVL